MTVADIEPLTIRERSDGSDRLWVSQWYQVTPRTFEHFELFFEAEAIYCVFAEESYKSFLLRRDGRERAATETGRKIIDLSPTQLLNNPRSFEISVSSVSKIHVREGSLLFKPKFEIFDGEQSHTFYHQSRSYDVDGLVTKLKSFYDESSVEIVHSAGIG